MAFTYTAPGDTDLSTVRFLIQDTVEATAAFSDAEITWALTETANVYLCAAGLAGTLAIKFARQADKTTGDLSISYSTRARTFAELAAALTAQANRRSVPTPFAGGISKADKDTNRDDDDIVEPAFVRDGMDNVGVDGDAVNDIYAGYDEGY